MRKQRVADARDRALAALCHVQAREIGRHAGEHGENQRGQRAEHDVLPQEFPPAECFDPARQKPRQIERRVVDDRVNRDADDLRGHVVCENRNDDGDERQNEMAAQPLRERHKPQNACVFYFLLHKIPAFPMGAALLGRPICAVPIAQRSRVRA